MKQNISCYYKILISSIAVILLIFLSDIIFSGPADLSIELRDSSERICIGKNIEFLEDKENSLDIDSILKDIQTGEDSLKWIRSIKDFPSFGFSSSVYWIKFSIINKTEKNKKWSLVLDYPLIDMINLYIVNRKGEIQEKSAGDHFPFNNREVAYRNFIFHIEDGNLKGNRYFLQVKTSSSVNLPLWIMSSVEVSKKIANEQLLLGLYYGLMLVIALYNLFIYSVVRDKNYLYYIIWIFGYGMYQVTLNGLSYQYFWPESIWWANNSLPVFIFFGATFCVQFGRSFLRTSENMPWADKLLVSIMALTASGTLLSFFLPYYIVIRIGTATVVLCTGSLLVLGIISFFRGFRAARFYITAWVTLLSGVIIYALKTFGILPVNFITSWSQQIGSALEVTLLSFALADRIKYIEQEKMEAHLEKDKVQERYRLLLEGTKDIVFTLDENWNFLTVNKALYDNLKINPEDIISKNFLDLIFDDSDEEAVTKQLVRDKLEMLSGEKKTINFKTRFRLPIGTEFLEMHVWLEKINIQGKNEIFGKAANIREDALLKYFKYEKQQFAIENQLSTAEDVSYRITRNLYKYMQDRDVNFIRIALREMIINAIEHGNLKLSYKDKTEALMNDMYFHEISQRQSDPVCKEKRVNIDYTVDSEKVIFSVTDEGDGFDHETILNGNSRNANEEMLDHGRGISMAKNVFDEVRYNKKGNQVMLTKFF